MTTLAQLVTDTRSILYGMELVERPAEDTLNGAITSGAASKWDDYFQDENLYLPTEVPLIEGLMVWSGFETGEVEEDT
jgi:hypothetical protein